MLPAHDCLVSKSNWYVKIIVNVISLFVYINFPFFQETKHHGFLSSVSRFAVDVVVMT